MISKEELEKLLPQLEQDRIEKTVSVNDAQKFGEAICAFANDLANHKQPGYLIIGARDDGARAGIRRGVANEADERILTEKRTAFARTFDVLPCKGSTLKDISIELFKLRYLPSAIASDILAENGRDLKEQLASLKFYDLKEDCPTYAGILMFGTNPRYYIPGAYVQYVRFEGEDEISDVQFEHTFDGDLTTQLGQMEQFIKANIVKMVLPELGGDYVANYPLSAVKELLFNAVIHKDYQSNGPIRFYEFSDRIEISNAGGLYGKARPENFPNENDYRNPALAEAVKNLGFVNQFNIGVKRAKAALQKNSNPEPEFVINQPTSFLVKIFKRQ